jgi:hypothetical protein
MILIVSSINESAASMKFTSNGNEFKRAQSDNGTQVLHFWKRCVAKSHEDGEAGGGKDSSLRATNEAQWEGSDPSRIIDWHDAG